MGFSSTMMMAVGAGASAVGSYNQARMQKAALENQSQISNWQSSQAMAAGEAQQQSVGLHEAQVLGAQRAGLAANGVVLGEGSAADLMAGTKFMGDRDQMTIRDNALRTAWAYRTQSDVEKSMAGNISPTLGAFTSLLGGAGQVYGSWQKWKTAGGKLPDWTSGGQ